MAAISNRPSTARPGKRLAHLLYPNRCPACGTLLPNAQEVFCAPCLSTMPEGGTPFPLPGLTNVYALYRYQGRAVDLIRRMKFKRVLSGIPYLGSQLARQVTPDFDVVCYVPSSLWRRRKRGYQHTRLLARQVSQDLGLPLKGFLRKRRNTPSQFTLDSDEARAKNVKDAFSLGHASPKGQRVLLVDDVCTSGATLSACAGVLLAGGASAVTGLVIARAGRHRWK